MPHVNYAKALVFPLMTVLFLFLMLACATRENQVTTDNPDPNVHVYGPYRVIRLPITKGVPMGNPIQIARGPGDAIFASNQTGEVYRLIDTDGDGLEDTAALYCNVTDDGLRSPAGFTSKGDTVFIGTAQQIRAYRDTNNDGSADTSWTFFDRIPESAHPYEWTSGLCFGPDGWLHIALTTDSWNAAPSPDPLRYRGSILRISPDGSKAEVMGTGIRSVPSMAFHPNGDLFFTDNEGGGNPTEELNLLVKDAFYGHNKKKFPEAEAIEKPLFDFTQEVAPSEIEFITEPNWWGNDGVQLLVSYYGPGERWTRGAVSRVEVRQDEQGHYRFTEFLIADVPKLSDLALARNGDIYLSHHGEADYWYNAVYENQGGFYKIVYDPSVKVTQTTRPKPDKTFSKNAIESEKQLFAERACLGCHQVDGVTELLGPNLQDIGQRMSREEILDEIQNPSARIKASMMGIRILKTDGQSLLGRVITSDTESLTLMLVGNQVVTVSRKDIEKTEDVNTSLMYANLLNGMTE